MDEVQAEIPSDTDEEDHGPGFKTKEIGTICHWVPERGDNRTAEAIHRVVEDHATSGDGQTAHFIQPKRPEITRLSREEMADTFEAYLDYQMIPHLEKLDYLLTNQLSWFP
jgi:hypothetical protein